jgi:hypothetical protein
LSYEWRNFEKLLITSKLEELSYKSSINKNKKMNSTNPINMEIFEDNGLLKEDVENDKYFNLLKDFYLEDEIKRLSL